MQPISNWRLAAFAGPSAASAAAGLPIALYLPAYYAAELGLGLTAVGSLFMLTKIWDVVTDPIAGVVTDRYRIGRGLRRPWMALGAPLMLACAVLVFFPERLAPGGAVRLPYLVLALLGFYSGFTLLQISHTAWGAELSDEYHERSRLQGWIQMFSLAGSFTVIAIPALIEQLGEDISYRQRVESMGWYMALVLPLTVVLALTSVPERASAPRPRIGLRRAIAAVFENRSMLRLLAADLLLALPAAARASLYVFFVGHVIGRPDLTSVILLLYFATGPIAIPLWIRISRAVGKHRALAYGLVAHALFALAYLIPGRGDAALFVCIHLFSAFVYGGHAFLIRSMVADVTDADRVISGQQRTGLYYSLVTMTSKVGMAVGIGIIYPVLDWIGFDPRGESTASGIDGLRYLFVFVPLIAELGVAWILYQYPLDEDTQRALRRRIEQADAGAPEAPI
jgi:Na+/melibiose symporter-like transporter